MRHYRVGSHSWRSDVSCRLCRSSSHDTKPRLQLILSPAKNHEFFSPCPVADKAGSSEAVGLQRVDELASVMAEAIESPAQGLLRCLGRHRVGELRALPELGERGTAAGRRCVQRVRVRQARRPHAHRGPAPRRPEAAPHPERHVGPGAAARPDQALSPRDGVQEARAALQQAGALLARPVDGDAARGVQRRW